MPVVGDYEMLCEMLYGATCSGTDLHLIHGRFPFPVQYPTVLGHESVGRVIAVGAKVRNFACGDLVSRVGTPPVEGLAVNWGGFAEHGLARDYRAMRDDGLPAAEWSGYRINQFIPATIDPRAATMIITWRETYSYLTRIGVKAGAAVLVVGSGGNGLSFLSHARNYGAPRIVNVGNAARETHARRAGASAYYDYAGANIANTINADFPDGFDLIIDAVGKRSTLDAVLPCLKPGGIIGIYGVDEYGATQLTPTRARGAFTYANYGYDEEESHDAIIAHMEQGRLDAGIWLDLDAAPYALADINAAFDAVRARQVVKALVSLSAK
jgi:D-arabinose 1-dehydrogenase-like Zn-dependent alcohol dehydrogenase